MSRNTYENTIILAVCGKSGAGKDALASTLYTKLSAFSYNYVVNVVSDTTRPPREGEKDGIHYNFISEDLFKKRKAYGVYLESTEFRGWHYGTPFPGIIPNAINIMVVNPDGLRTLQKVQHMFGKVIPVYVKAPLRKRLLRSIKREGKFKFEYLRRAFTDFKDFRGINKLLRHFYYDIIIENKWSMYVAERTVFYYLMRYDLLSWSLWAKESNL